MSIPLGTGKWLLAGSAISAAWAAREGLSSSLWAVQHEKKMRYKISMDVAAATVVSKCH
jgi:hypothetical protein